LSNTDWLFTKYKLLYLATMRLVLCDDVAATTTTNSVVNSTTCFLPTLQQHTSSVNSFINNSNTASQVLNNLAGLQQPIPTPTSLHLNETRLQQQQSDFLALHRNLFTKRPPVAAENFGPQLVAPPVNFSRSMVPTTNTNLSAMPASGLLNSFLMLNPLNPDFKRIYFSMLPKVRFLGFDFLFIMDFGLPNLI